MVERVREAAKVLAADLRDRPPPTVQGDLAKLPKALHPLTQKHRWVCWKWELVGNKKTGKKWTKMPYQARNTNAKASSTEPKTWGSYDDAVHAWEQRRVDGIGYVLTD